MGNLPTLALIFWDGLLTGFVMYLLNKEWHRND